VKFLADMGISPRIVEHLRRRGHDAVHLYELELQASTDAAVLQKAWEEGRILLTHDLDFGELLAAGRRRLPSVILFRLKDMRPANIKSHLGAVLEHHVDALQKGAVCSVSERKVRVRMLPI